MVHFFGIFFLGSFGFMAGGYLGLCGGEYRHEANDQRAGKRYPQVPSENDRYTYEAAQCRICG
jgi:hypothetical protein